MGLRFFKTFLAIFLAVAVLIPSSGLTFDSCADDAGLSLEMGPQLSHCDERTPASAPHTQDCDCTLHCNSCHHASFYFMREQSSSVNDLALVSFSEIRSLPKAAPFLDGPFQPPCA